jgi:hypothetical protein
LNTDDGKIYLGNSEFVIYVTQQILEFHYLLKCNYFSEKRKTCLDKKYFKNCNILKFGTLMNQTKKSKIKKLCTFIRYINEKKMLNSTGPRIDPCGTPL